MAETDFRALCAELTDFLAGLPFGTCEELLIRARAALAADGPVAIPGEEYHEDMGAVTWWRFPVDEPPWVGTPNDSDWPGYHTHFTPAPPEPAHALTLPAGEVSDDR